MSDSAADMLLSLEGAAEEILQTAKTARKNSKSLLGDNHYGHKFHALTVDIAAAEAKLLEVFKAVPSLAVRSAELSSITSQLVSAALDDKLRTDAVRRLTLLSRTVLEPALRRPPDHPTPTGESVLALAVVQPTRRGYLVSVVTQANACYEARCFDACSVMIRKLVEILIIELYEAKKLEVKIKNAAGVYLMLSDLIQNTLHEVSWTLARESRRALPDLKSLGDRSAHNRRYVATRQDVDSVLSGLRVVVDDLLHLSGLK